MHNILILGFLFISLFTTTSFAEDSFEMRIDLGVETCPLEKSKQEFCRRTPLSGENRKLVFVRQGTKDLWIADWRDKIKHGDYQFKAKVSIIADGSTGGLSYKLHATHQDGSSSMHWFNNLSQLNYSELRGQKISNNNTSIMPYIVFAPKAR